MVDALEVAGVEVLLVDGGRQTAVGGTVVVEGLLHWKNYMRRKNKWDGRAAAARGRVVMGEKGGFAAGIGSPKDEAKRIASQLDFRE